MTTTTMSGRAWAYTGATLGGLVSIAANIAHSYVPPQTASADWAPKFGAVVGAVVWPIFLFVAVEILARVAWPHGLTWLLLKWAGLLPVASVAALVSYRHLSGLLAFYGDEPIVWILGPLAVDGLMVMATGALLATSQHTRTNRNTTPDSPAARPVSAPAGPAPTLPPSMKDTVSPSSDGTTTSTTTTSNTPEPAPVPAEIPTPAVVAARITPAKTSTPNRPETATRAPALPPSPRPRKADAPSATRLAAPATDTPVTAPDAAQLALPMVAPDLLGRADTVARQYRTEHGTPITPGQLAVRLKVTSEQAAQALAVLNLGPNNPTTPIPTVNGNRHPANR